ncbi:WXG100 family type VII secretion target [Nocardia sp. GAS34]|uniref:WXG100 family type VII secretion target n=1 Tax=unclassified Nocardia TaxID=2637762 RepID=UPI003D194F9C
MTVPFDVDLDELDDLVACLKNLAVFITEHLDVLDQKTAAVHTGSWSGAAADTHRQAHREWSAAAREFRDGIAAMSTAAREAHDHYSSAKNTNNSMLRGD